MQKRIQKVQDSSNRYASSDCVDEVLTSKTTVLLPGYNRDWRSYFVMPLNR